MPDDKFVSEEEFRKILRAQFELTVDLMVRIGTLNYVLAEKGLLPSEERMTEIRQFVENQPATKTLRESLGKIQDFQSIDQILRDFQGPIQ